jgi:hypothetical protein
MKSRDTTGKVLYTFEAVHCALKCQLNFGGIQFNLVIILNPGEVPDGARYRAVQSRTVATPGELGGHTRARMAIAGAVYSNVCVNVAGHGSRACRVDEVCRAAVALTYVAYTRMTCRMQCPGAPYSCVVLVN